MNNKLVLRILVIFLLFSFVIFGLEVYFKFGNPWFIIGLDFLIFGFLLIKYYTYGYLITIVGLYILLYSLGIWKIDSNIFRYVIVILFPIVPGFILFSEWNDKRRFFKKGCSEVEAIYKGTNFYDGNKFEYCLDNKKYVGISYKRGYFNYRQNEKVKVYVANENPEKIFVDMPEKQIKLIKIITLLFLILAIFIILLMLFE